MSSHDGIRVHDPRSKIPVNLKAKVVLRLFRAKDVAKLRLTCTSCAVAVDTFAESALRERSERYCDRELYPIGAAKRPAAVDGRMTYFPLAKRRVAMACLGPEPGACKLADHQQHAKGALYHACSVGHAGCFFALANRGLSLTPGLAQSCAFAAVGDGHTQCLKALATFKVDLNATSEELQVAPIHVAATMGQPLCIRVLHALGADVNKPDANGSCAVHHAAFYGHPACIAALHAVGANLSCLDGEGWTPIHRALLRDQDECVRMLHTLGADINRPNSDGQTPLYMATRQRRDACAALLTSLGAISRDEPHQPTTREHFELGNLDNLGQHSTALTRR